MNNRIIIGSPIQGINAGKWVLCLLLAITCLLPGCQKSLDEKIIYLDNGMLRLGFDRNTGALVEMRDLVQSVDFLESDSILGPPWEIILLQKGKIQPIDPAIPFAFSFSAKGGQSIKMTWLSKGNTGDPPFSVTVHVNLEAEKPMSNWNISLSGIPSGKIHSVVFPSITGLKELKNERLVVPHWMGQEIENPRDFLSSMTSGIRKLEWEYPGQLSMQFISLYSLGSSGFYFSGRDTLAFRKNYSVSLDTLNLLSFRIHNFLSLDKNSGNYSLPSSAVIGCFTGDWYTTAEIYREWANEQHWCRESRFRNKLSPGWLDSTALWVWNRGTSDNVLNPAIDLQQRLDLPVNVFWHWWHGCAYDVGFPEYFPPREGRDPFIEAVSEAERNNIHAIVYMNVLQWGTSTESWEKENAALRAVRNIDGSLRSHVYNIFTGKSLTNMCMGTRFWKDKYASLAMKAIKEYGLSGIYMDQACLSRMCYSMDHDHVPGGGNYWVEHFGKLAGKIRNNVMEREMPVLAGEGGGESWIPYLDAFLTLQVSKERYAGPGIWETLPLFQAVYHPYAITYGNYSSLVSPPYDDLWPEEYAPDNPLSLLDEAYNEQFLMEQARSFVWGMQPAIANYQPSLARSRKNEIGYLLRLARVRQTGLKYLHHGKFLRSPEMEIPSKEMDISRLSIYAGRGRENVTSFKAVYPLIYTGTWQADDNRIGIAVASIIHKPYPFRLNFSSLKYGLPLNGSVFLIDEEGRRLIKNYSGGTISLDYELPPMGVVIIEIAE
jgi:hypothetical protein